MIPRQRHNPDGWAVEVGDRQHGGQVGAAIDHTPEGGRVVVGVAHLGAMAVDISIDDAAELCVKLAALINAYRRRAHQRP